MVSGVRYMYTCVLKEMFNKTFLNEVKKLTLYWLGIFYICYSSLSNANEQMYVGYVLLYLVVCG